MLPCYDFVEVDGGGRGCLAARDIQRGEQIVPPEEPLLMFTSLQGPKSLVEETFGFPIDWSRTVQVESFVDCAQCELVRCLADRLPSSSRQHLEDDYCADGLMSSACLRATPAGWRRDLHRILATNAHNLMGILEKEVLYGLALFEEGRKFNHRCSYPSAEHIVAAARGVVVALRDIPAGEEITINYSTVLDASIVQTHREILQNFGFCCACPDCVEAGLEDVDCLEKVKRALEPVFEDVFSGEGAKFYEKHTDLFKWMELLKQGRTEEKFRFSAKAVESLWQKHICPAIQLMSRELGKIDRNSDTFVIMCRCKVVFLPLIRLYCLLVTTENTEVLSRLEAFGELTVVFLDVLDSLGVRELRTTYTALTLSFVGSCAAMYGTDPDDAKETLAGNHKRLRTSLVETLGPDLTDHMLTMEKKTCVLYALAESLLA